VARNFLLSSELKFSRKIREMVLAMRIDNAFSQGSDPRALSERDFSWRKFLRGRRGGDQLFWQVAGRAHARASCVPRRLAQGPANYSPTRHKDAAIARRNYVLDQMQENSYITRDQMAAADADDLVTYNRPFGAVVTDVDYFVEEVRRTLQTKYGDKALYDGGLQVRSTLDPRLQDIAVRSLRAGAARL